jgi:hypothetical protein
MILADTSHFGTDPDPRIPTSIKARNQIQLSVSLEQGVSPEELEIVQRKETSLGMSPSC